MAALISWVCRVDHTVKAGQQLRTTVTVYRGAWAYCPQGSFTDCIWQATEPTPYEQLRSVRRPSETAAQQQATRGGG